MGTGPVHAWASDPSTRAVLDGLLDPALLERPTDQLSGGQMRRVALAAALVAQPDVLLLDEPTNHLDIEAIGWLAAYLQGWPKGRRALVVVTHDRWFLDEVTTRTWEVGRAGLSATRAATPPTSWHEPSANSRNRPSKHAGRTFFARNSPGCAVARLPGRRSPNSARMQPWS